MKGRTARLAMTALAAGILGGCDSFSLLDQFVLNGGLKIVLETSELMPGATSRLYPEGGTGPYSLYCTNDDLYNDGTAIDLGELDDAGPDYSYTAGYSIGQVEIHCRDGAGLSGSATITVLPHPPVSVVADGAYGDNNDVQITWSYPHTDKIQGFRILRSKDGGSTFQTLADASSLSVSTTVYNDGDALVSSMNYYRVYAFAGSYSSSYGEASAKGKP